MSCSPRKIVQLLLIDWIANTNQINLKNQRSREQSKVQTRHIFLGPEIPEISGSGRRRGSFAVIIIWLCPHFDSGWDEKQVG